jgi:hypothetical protein
VAVAGESTPADALVVLAQRAVGLAKTARKHRKSLSGDNFYGNRLAGLRADAINAFRQLALRSAGDSAAIAELVEAVFSPTTAKDRRLEASRDLVVALKTTWRGPDVAAGPAAGLDVFPLALLAQANRGYLVTIGRQMNACFQAGWFDACAVMMRKLLEVAIIEAFEARGVAHKIKDADDNYIQLSPMITAALAETTWTLSKNTKKYLPQLRDAGHQSAHGRYYHAGVQDIERIQPWCRVVIEEFLHHAKLL